ncbi:MAG: hypothetical protein CMK59_02940 [Proteobacteria bacterium]|nr:hypothetical protein [Pseudomonadota bacterium]
MPTTHRLIQLSIINSQTWLVRPANAHQEHLLLRWESCPQTVVPIHTHLGCWISEGLVDLKVASIERISAVHSLRERIPPKDRQGIAYQQILEILSFLHDNNVAHGKIDPDEIWFKEDGSIMLTGTALIRGHFEQDLIALEQLWEHLELCKEEQNSPDEWKPQWDRSPKQEFLYEWIQNAPRHKADLPLIQEYSESTAPQLLHFDDDSEENTQTAKLNILSTLPLIEDINLERPIFNIELTLPYLPLFELPQLVQEEENTQNSTRPLIESNPFTFRSNAKVKKTKHKDSIGLTLIGIACTAFCLLLFWCFKVLTA